MQRLLDRVDDRADVDVSHDAAPGMFAIATWARRAMSWAARRPLGALSTLLAASALRSRRCPRRHGEVGGDGVVAGWDRLTRSGASGGGLLLLPRPSLASLPPP